MLRTRLAAALLISTCSPASTPASPAPEVDWAELPATVDQPGDEAWLTRSPDGQIILFGRHQPDYSGHHIYLTRLIDGAWTEPVEAPFTGGKEATAPARGTAAGTLTATGEPGRWTLALDQRLAGGTEAQVTVHASLTTGVLADSPVQGSASIRSRDPEATLRDLAALGLSLPADIAGVAMGPSSIEARLGGTIANPSIVAAVDAQDVALAGGRPLHLAGTVGLDRQFVRLDPLSVTGPLGNTIEARGTLGLGDAPGQGVDQVGQENEKAPSFMIPIFKLPVFLYRLRLGWLLGNASCRSPMLAATAGRCAEPSWRSCDSTRKPKRFTQFPPWTGSDWYYNIQASPALQVETGFVRYIPVQRTDCLRKRLPPRLSNIARNTRSSVG